MKSVNVFLVLFVVLCFAEMGFMWTAEGTEVIQEKTAKETEKQLKEILKSNSVERSAITTDLIKFSFDEKQNNDERISVILMMSEIGTDEVIDFCLQNINLHITKTYFRNDDDWEKEKPCLYTLQHMGWKTLPRILEFLKKERPKDEIELIAVLLERVCGKSVAISILENQQKLNIGVKPSNIEMLLTKLRIKTEE